MKTFSIIFISCLILLSGCDKPTSKSLDNIDLAKFYAENGSYSQSIITLQNEIKKNQSNKDAHYLLAKIYFDLEYLSEAEENIRQARALGCDSSECKLLLLDILIANKKIDKAAAIIPDVFVADSDKKLLRKIQIEYLRDHDLEELKSRIGALKSIQAREFLLKAQYENKKYIELYEAYHQGGDFSVDELLIFAKVLYVLNKYQDAEKVLLEVRLKDKSDMISRRKIETVEILVRVDVALGKFAEADAINQAFLKNHEGSGYAVFKNTINDLKTANYKAAIKSIEGMVKANPDNLQSNLLLAFAYFGQRDYQSVISTLNKFKENLDPRYKLLLATSYFNTGNPKAVVDYLAEDTNDNLSRLLLAKATISTGDKEKARKLISGISLDDQSFQISQKEDYAEILYKLRQFDRLIQDFSKKNDNSPKLNRLIINSYLENGDSERAEQFLVSLNDTVLQRELSAQILLKKNDLEGAISEYKEVVKDRGNKADYSTLARLYIANKQIKKGFDCLINALNQEGDNTKILALIYQFLATNSDIEFFSRLEQIPDDHQDYSAVQLLLASIDFRSGQLEKSAQRLQQFDQVNDSRVILLKALSENQGAPEESVKQIEDLFQHEYSLQIAQILFTYYQQFNKSGQLKNLLERVRKEDGVSLLTAPMIAKGSLSLKQFKQANEMAAFLKKNGREFLANDIFADVAFLNREYSEAVKLYKQNVLNSPNESTLIKLYRSKLMERHFISDRELTEADGWLDKFPEMWLFRRFVANQYIPKDIKLAADHFSKLIIHYPDDKEILNNYAWCLLDIDLEKSLKYAQKAHQLYPDSAEVIDTLSVALYKNDQHDAAVLLLKDAIKNIPDKLLKERLSEFES